MRRDGVGTGRIARLAQADARAVVGVGVAGDLAGQGLDFAQAVGVVVDIVDRVGRADFPRGVAGGVVGVGRDTGRCARYRAGQGDGFGLQSVVGVVDVIGRRGAGRATCGAERLCLRRGSCISRAGTQIS